MAMLRFTAAGVVAAPTSVQIRVTHELPGRLQAGAPVRPAGLSDEEIRDNLHYFVVSLSGPRTRPCDSLVLSGVDLASRRGLVPILREASSWGLKRVTLHLGRGQRLGLRRSALRPCVDDLAIVVANEQDLADVGALARAGFAVTAVLPLGQRGLARLQGLAAKVGALGAERAVLTWPLSGTPPPHAARVATALPAAVQALEDAGCEVRIKGLPLCTLGPLSDRAARTRNRWYVDADHQQDKALLFFPDVLRWEKVDTCRFCAVESRCDGAPAQWLRRRLVPGLRAVSHNARSAQD